MRLEWLEDILAVLETGSFIRAAEKRYLTQPAFSRRIKTIENYVGVELFDRSRKPAQLKKSVIDQKSNIQELVTGLRDLLHELKRQDRETHKLIVISSQHAITTSIAPEIVKKLSINKEINIRLRSFNRDECFASLISKQADLLLVYQFADEELPSQQGFLELRQLGTDRLIPVCATAELQRLKKEYKREKLDAVVYPADVFFGQLLNQEVLPRINATVSVHKKVETALTPAALKLVLAGVGVAWLPQSLVAAEISCGSLTELSDMLPDCMLSIAAIRLNDLNSPAKELVWQAISSITLHQAE